jgi:hypothetical protein
VRNVEDGWWRPWKPVTLTLPVHVAKRAIATPRKALHAGRRGVGLERRTLERRELGEDEPACVSLRGTVNDEIRCHRSKG